MKPTRRELVVGGMAIAVLGGSASAAEPGEQAMYGLIGKMTAKPGQRDALVSILLDGVADMPGCLSYIVAIDPADADAIWITEAWDNEASHKASLSLPSVKAAIKQAMPRIAEFGDGTVTRPVGGHGLAPTRR